MAKIRRGNRTTSFGRVPRASVIFRLAEKRAAKSGKPMETAQEMINLVNGNHSKSTFLIGVN